MFLRLATIILVGHVENEYLTWPFQRCLKLSLNCFMASDVARAREFVQVEFESFHSVYIVFWIFSNRTKLPLWVESFPTS